MVRKTTSRREDWGKRVEESFQILDEDLRIAFRRPKCIVQGALFLGVWRGLGCGLLFRGLRSGLRRAQMQRPKGPQQAKTEDKR